MKKAEEQIKIESDIPYPKRLSLAEKYPFGKMKVNDSFYTELSRKLIAGAASRYGRRNNKRFSIRSEGSGCRVWRIE